MSTNQSLFSQTVLKEYMGLQQVVVEAKYALLKLILSPSLTDATKQTLKDEVVGIAATVHTHFVELAARDINQYNVDDFERRELSFVKDVQHRLDGFLKRATKVSPVRIRYAADPVPEKEIDDRLVESRVFDHAGLERQHIESLGQFERYLLDRVYVPADQDRKIERETGVEKELLDMKIRNYTERIAALRPENPDILYRMRVKIENAAAHDARVNVVADGDGKLGERLNDGELYVRVDDRYNVVIFYEQQGARLELRILLAGTISGDGITYTGRIEGETRVGVNRVAVSVADARDATARRLSLEEYRVVYQKFLELTDFDRIYRFALAVARKRRTEESERSRRVDEEMKRKVSSALDDIL